MDSYKITNMIIDNDYKTEEFVTTDFTYQGQNYSVTFNKGDLELVNSWVFTDETSLPADLSEQMIDAIRTDIQKRI